MEGTPYTNIQWIIQQNLTNKDDLYALIKQSFNFLDHSS